MTPYSLMVAIGMINDEDILDAKDAGQTIVDVRVKQKSCAGRKSGEKSGGKFNRRIAISLAAVIIILLSSFATAMAVNKEFREAVYSFFHISTPDIVLPIDDEPLQFNDVEKIYETNIENAVNVQYIKIKGNFDYGRGLIYLYDESGNYGESDSDVKSDNGAMFYTIRDGQLAKLETNKIKLNHSWEGIDYKIEFSWCEEDGAIYVYSRGKEPASDVFWYVSPINGRSDVVTLTLARGRQDDYSEKTFLLDLNTKEVSDVLTGSEVNQLNDIASTEFSNLPTYSRISGNGFIFTGIRYGLYIDLDKTTYVYDFKEKTRALVEGLTYSGENASININPKGTKILVTMFDQAVDGLGISLLGVIDMEKGTYTVLEREGYEVRRENTVGWFDNDRISILASNSSGENYLYLYSFTN